MVDSTLTWPLPENLLDNLEHRFKQYEKSDSYNPRLIWDEECVKIVIGAKNPLLRAFGFLFVCVVCIIITVTISWPESGVAAFFGFVCLILGLSGLRGNQTLLIHENHLEIRFDRMNSGSSGMENPNCYSTEIKREDITAIKYCAVTLVHEGVKHHDQTNSFNEADYGTSSRTTTYQETDNTRILLALTDEMKAHGMEYDENPWFDIRSKKKVEAEELAEALNFLILPNSD